MVFEKYVYVLFSLLEYNDYCIPDEENVIKHPQSVYESIQRFIGGMLLNDALIRHAVFHSCNTNTSFDFFVNIIVPWPRILQNMLISFIKFGITRCTHSASTTIIVRQLQLLYYPCLFHYSETTMCQRKRIKAPSSCLMSTSTQTSLIK